MTRKTLATALLFIFILSACGSNVETIPTSTSVPSLQATSTFTPEPTATHESVEVTETVTDVPTLLDEETQYWVEKLGYESYDALVQDKVMSGYIESYNGLSYAVGLPYDLKSSQGYVLEQIVVRSGNRDVLCALTAFPNSTQLGCVELGYTEDGKFVPLVTNLFEYHGPSDYDPKVKFDSPDDYKVLNGKLWTFRIVAGVEQPQAGEAYTKLVENKDTNPSYQVGYRDQVKLRGQWADEFWAEIVNPNASPLIVKKYQVENYQTIPPQFGSQSAMNGGASVIWTLDQLGTDSPFILIDRLASSDQDGEKVREN